MISSTIMPLYLPCRGEGLDEGGGEEEGRAGADSRLGVLLCVAVFSISSARRLQTNPWRLLPYSGNTSLTDRRSDFSSPNNYGETEKHNPNEHAKSLTDAFIETSACSW